MKKWRPSRVAHSDSIGGLRVEPRPFQPRHSHVTHGLSKKVKIQEAEGVKHVFHRGRYVQARRLRKVLIFSSLFLSKPLKPKSPLSQVLLARTSDSWGHLDRLGSSSWCLPPETVVSQPWNVLSCFFPAHPPFFQSQNFLTPRAWWALGHLICGRGREDINPEAIRDNSSCLHLADVKIMNLPGLTMGKKRLMFYEPHGSYCPWLWRQRKKQSGYFGILVWAKFPGLGFKGTNCPPGKGWNYPFCHKVCEVFCRLPGLSIAFAIC